MFMAGMSLRELSRRTGFSPPALNHYANNRRSPTDETIVAIAAALELEPASFFEWRRRRAHAHVDEQPQLVEAIYQRTLSTGGR